MFPAVDVAITISIKSPLKVPSFATLSKYTKSKLLVLYVPYLEGNCHNDHVNENEYGINSLVNGINAIIISEKVYG